MRSCMQTAGNSIAFLQDSEHGLETPLDPHSRDWFDLEWYVRARAVRISFRSVSLRLNLQFY